MKTNTFIGSVLMALAMLGTGYWLGRHNAVPPAKASGPRGGDARKPVPLPPVRTGRNFARTVDTLRAAPGARFSLAQIEARVQELAQGGTWRANKEWQKIVESIAPGDMPHLLAIVEKIPNKNTRDGVRYSLLSRWAEGDPPGAISYAQ